MALRPIADDSSGPVVIVASVERELVQLARELNAEPMTDPHGRRIWRADAATGPVYMAVSGIGKVNAAVVSTLLLERFSPRLLINIGCGGAYRESGLQVGNLAVAISEVYGDEGVLTLEGWHSLELIGIPSVERKGNRYSNEFPLSMQVAGRVFQFASSLGLPVKRGKFITVSTCSGTTNRGDELYNRFGGICENMEGAAVAHVALLYDTPLLEVRGISNMVEDRDISKWDIPLSVEMVQRFLFKCFERGLF